MEENTQDIMSLQEIVEGLQNHNSEIRYLAAQNARKILSSRKDQFKATKYLIEAGAVPNLVACLTDNNNANLQSEACWALSIIAAGDTQETETVISAGAVPIFIRLLGSEANVSEPAVLALGNIAGDCPQFRDLVMNHGILPPLLSLVTPDIPTALSRNIAWILYVLFDKRYPRNDEALNLCLSTFVFLISHPDPETVHDVCCAISCVVHVSDENIQKIIDAGVITKLVEFLYNNNDKILEPAVTCIHYITKSQNPAFMQAVIDAGALVHLKKLPWKTYEGIVVQKDVVKKTFKIISSITAGNTNQIQAIIDHGIIEDAIFALYYHSYDWKAKTAIVKAVTNVTVGGTLDQIMHLVQTDTIIWLFDSLPCSPFPRIILNVLTNIFNALIKVGAFEVACFYIEQSNGLDKLITLVEDIDDKDLEEYAYANDDEYLQCMEFRDSVLHMLKLTLYPS